MQPIYTTEQAAEYLGVDPVTVWRARRSGLLACRKIGRLIRFLESDLTEYMERIKDERKVKARKQTRV